MNKIKSIGRPRYLTKARRPVPLLLLLSFWAVLSACSETDAEPTDVIDPATCGCTEDCENMCDVSVRLESDCRGVLEEAEVFINGELRGMVTLETPFRSCEVFDCNASNLIRVSGGGFSTRETSLPAYLDPEVPLSCSNL